MLLCSLKRQQQNQWPRLYCLYLLLVKPTLLEGASVIQRAKLGWLETAWEGSGLQQSLMVYPAPSLTGEILGSLKSYWFQRRFLSLAPFSTMPIASCLPFPAESLGSALSPTAFWKVHLLPSHGLGKASPGRVCQATAAGQGQVWPVQLQNSACSLLHRVSQCN